ncbi:MAG: transposase zinc-binding domain-containing protein [Sandaracinaceae bacterium]|nr:transposase zinc-binding domain-containing protein [Sandaracinaceae bacterium]
MLAHGAVRFLCEHCGRDRLVGLSCKGRGFCPRCLGRRMTEMARHWVSAVLPRVRVSNGFSRCPSSCACRWPGSGAEPRVNRAPRPHARRARRGPADPHTARRGSRGYSSLRRRPEHQGGVHDVVSKGARRPRGGRDRAGLVCDGLVRDGLARDGLAPDGLARDGLARDGLVRDRLRQHTVDRVRRPRRAMLWRDGRALSGRAPLPAGGRDGGLPPRRSRRRSGCPVVDRRRLRARRCLHPAPRRCLQPAACRLRPGRVRVGHRRSTLDTAVHGLVRRRGPADRGCPDDGPRPLAARRSRRARRRRLARLQLVRPLWGAPRHDPRVLGTTVVSHRALGPPRRDAGSGGRDSRASRRAGDRTRRRPHDVRGGRADGRGGPLVPPGAAGAGLRPRVGGHRSQHLGDGRRPVRRLLWRQLLRRDDRD